MSRSFGSAIFHMERFRPESHVFLRMAQLVQNRIVLGDKVIDHERVWGVRDSPIEVAAIYQVVGGLIERVWFFSPE